MISVTEKQLEYIEEVFGKEVKDYKNPNCTGCVDCCSLATMITEEEYKKLKKFFSKDKQGKEIYKKSVKVMQGYNAKGYVFMRCPLINFESNRCRIYSNRPSICKDFHCSPELDKVKDRKMEYSSGRTIGDLFKKYLGTTGKRKD